VRHLLSDYDTAKSGVDHTLRSDEYKKNEKGRTEGGV
jgi:hypothetical protein